MGLGPITSKQLLAYIINEYGSVTSEDLDENRDKMNEPWNSEQPIRTSRECRLFISDRHRDVVTRKNHRRRDE